MSAPPIPGASPLPVRAFYRCEHPNTTPSRAIIRMPAAPVRPARERMARVLILGFLNLVADRYGRGSDAFEVSVQVGNRVRPFLNTTEARAILSAMVDEGLLTASGPAHITYRVAEGGGL